MNTYCALLISVNVGGFAGQRPGVLDLAQAVADEFVLVAASQNLLTEQMVMNTVKKVFDPRESVATTVLLCIRFLHKAD